MAQYQTPPDPRETPLTRRRPRRQRSDRRDWVPLVGLLFGLIFTFVAIYIAWELVTLFLEKPPLDVEPLEPTVVVLTAPPSPTATEDSAEEEPTPLPTFAPEATIDPAIPPETVIVNGYAQVINTEGVGLSLRGGPSTDNVKLLTVPEGTTALVIEGPAEGSGFTWWKVRLEDGTEGWMAAQFMAPIAQEVDN